MDKDRVEGSAKETKAKPRRLPARCLVMLSRSPKARPTRRQERSRMLSAESKTRSRGSNRRGEVLVARNPVLRTVVNMCREQCEQLARNRDCRRVIGYLPHFLLRRDLAQ